MPGAVAPSLYSRRTLTWHRLQSRKPWRLGFTWVQGQGVGLVTPVALAAKSRLKAGEAFPAGKCCEAIRNLWQYPSFPRNSSVLLHANASSVTRCLIGPWPCFYPQRRSHYVSSWLSHRLLPSLQSPAFNPRHFPEFGRSQIGKPARLS